MIRGLITFNKRQCYFSLENFNLILEEIENRTDVSNDDLQELLRIKKIDIPDILVGRTFNNRQIVFKVMHGYKKAFKTYFFRIQLYVVFKTLETSFDAIQFKAEELNSFYPLKNAYSITSKEQTGEIEFVARPFTELERNFTFNFKEELINGKLNISRNIDWNNKSPLSLHTELTLYFEKSSDDYNKLQELTYAFINALSFLTYRKNISINEVSLKKIDEKSGDYLKIGTLHVLREGIKHIEEDPRIIREKIVDISIIEDNLGVLFESMLHKKIYLRHSQIIQKRKI